MAMKYTPHSTHRKQHTYYNTHTKHTDYIPSVTDFDTKFRNII